MRFLFFILFLNLNFSNLIYAQSKVEWIELDNNTKINNNGKKIIIDLYTDWCGWCKVMDRNTFTNPDVIDHINNNFIPVKFDAEYQNSVVFNNNSYNFVKSGKKGINELAYYLTNGNLSYPMTVFLDENYNLITLLPGYHKPNFYNLVLKYIGEDYWKDMSWDEYSKKHSR
jgi:thioredoxin-related protein